MFSNKKKRSTGSVSPKIDSLIGKNTELHGDVVFSGGFHLDGKVVGNIRAHEASSQLTVSDHGLIEGEVHVPNIVLNGTIKGNVYASERIELAANARVEGSVYYKLIEMAIGAEVNGNLVHQTDSATAKTDVKKAKQETAKS